MHPFSSDEFFHLALQIAGEESACVPEGKQEAKRIVIFGLRLGLPVRRRREYANVSAAPGEVITHDMLLHIHVMAARDFPQLLYCRSLRIDAEPELIWRKIFHDAREPSNMVTVRMREHNNIQMVDPTRPEIRRDNIFTIIKFAVQRPNASAGINQHGLSLGRYHQKRIALAHVNGRNLKLAGLYLRLRDARWPPARPWQRAPSSLPACEYLRVCRTAK